MRIKSPPKSDFQKFPPAKTLSDPQVQAALQKTRARHLHFDKFRFLPLPKGTSVSLLWNYVKYQRQADLIELPVQDEQGRAFRVCVPPDYLRLISQVDRQAAGSILTDSPQWPNKEQFIVSSLMEEAISSSLLEGAQTTRVAAKQMLLEGRKPRNKGERMVVNNWKAMEAIRERQNEPLSLALLLELHAIVTQDTLDDAQNCGRLRQHDDIAVVDFSTGEIIHQPPPFTLLEERLTTIFEWANDDDTSWLHPVVKASVLHFLLGYEHPFVDGNGRTARAIFYHFILSRGYWLFEYLPISRFFLRARGQYGRAFLHVETDEGDVTYFVAYSLRVVGLALEDMRLYLEQKRKRREKEQSAFVALPGDLNERQKALLVHAINHPNARYSVALHQNLHQVVYQTARADLLGLEAKGWLRKQKEGKKFVFVPIQERLHPATAQN